MTEGVGWIKLHRKIMSSKTFECLNAIQKLIAIYIVLNANHEDGMWHDKYKNVSVPVKRGQLITSRSKIVNDWFGNDKEVTEQKLRTALKKLEKVGFLTIESTKAYSLITVCNYWVYQQKESESNQASNHELTKDQPRTNHELTTNKNVKNDKNEKNDKNNHNPRNKISAGPDNPFNTYFLAFGNPSPFVLDDINFYLDAGVEEKAISYAIEKAAKNGSKFGYAKGILDNWIKNGTLTIEKVLEEEAAYQKRREDRIHANEKWPAGNRSNPKPIVKGSDREQFDWNRKTL